MGGMRAMALALGLALMPAAAVAGQDQGQDQGQILAVRQAWMRYLLPGIPAGGYMVLVNNSNYPAVLTGARAAPCATLMLHQSMNMGGTAMMMPVASVPVPAHGQAELVEGGYHLMCMQPRMKPGQTIAVTLEFGDGSTLAVNMPVYGPGGPP